MHMSAFRWHLSGILVTFFICALNTFLDLYDWYIPYRSMKQSRESALLMKCHRFNLLYDSFFTKILIKLLVLTHHFLCSHNLRIFAEELYMKLAISRHEDVWLSGQVKILQQHPLTPKESFDLLANYRSHEEDMYYSI